MALVLLKLLGVCAILGIAVALIDGEDVATIAEFPYLIAILDKGQNICGGSLIRLNVVLTAAHCVYDVPEKNLQVRAAALYREDNGKDVKKLPIARSIVHKNYDKDNQKHDIALLKTQRKFIKSSLIDTIDLPAQGVSYDLKVGTVMGWGDKLNGEATVLQKTTLAILDYTRCLNFYENDAVFTTNICMYDTIKPRTKALCNGDSGGPVAIHFKTKRDVIAGINSWTDEKDNKCSAEYPSVATNVENYLNWINHYFNQFDAAEKANHQKPDSHIKPQNIRPGSPTKPQNINPSSPTKPHNIRPGSPTKPQHFKPSSTRNTQKNKSSSTIS